MSAGTPDFAQLKAGMKAAWMAGDFGQIAAFSAKAAEEFVARSAVTQGTRVLDVACGTGNASIPAARAGGVVTGIDIAPNLLEQACARASAEQLTIDFREGDAEQLPFPDGAFDVVLTMFGAMFAPRPEQVAVELVRVCRPGGVIAMANWTPQGFVGRTFQLTAKMAPPPPGVPAPVLWGDEETVRRRFSKQVSSLSLTRQKISFDYPFPPNEVVAFFRQYFGPTQMAFKSLGLDGQAALASALESLWKEHNRAADGRTSVEAEYLDLRAIRA
jgi:ubiquinone/menaquinone biosynthesis C-methylase UbiE